MDTSDPRLWWLLNGGKIAYEMSRKTLRTFLPSPPLGGPSSQRSPPSLEPQVSIKSPTPRPTSSIYTTPSRRSDPSPYTPRSFNHWIEFLAPYWLTMVL